MPASTASLQHLTPIAALGDGQINAVVAAAAAAASGAASRSG
jgi:hypothetical protein